MFQVPPTMFHVFGHQYLWLRQFVVIEIAPEQSETRPYSTFDSVSETSSSSSIISSAPSSGSLLSVDCSTGCESSSKSSESSSKSINDLIRSRRRIELLSSCFTCLLLAS
ncbi:hypothetical protein DERP_012159 [Dermatophagoides pteronyssinus]|uniref:Uncharacterized protein n=1 Tax=Dermatophagoides pteronyssinus TaxID=6956 RepID=A0ABQ8J2A1_DERPT|nr:hypothetical protein DERP_012159 [Dermatophagoides pteronyssinus]